jgi:hypothetical protein
VAFSAAAPAANIHVIEELPNGFALFRSGEPGRSGIEEFKRLGITEIAVLAGNAESNESKYIDIHPDLKVVYNEEQETDTLPPQEFFDWFDRWIEEARREGKRIAIRCNCGCHRTGRLAAYYQMKWQNLPYQDAIILMKAHGKRMAYYPYLNNQVRILHQRILNQQAQESRTSASAR